MPLLVFSVSGLVFVIILSLFYNAAKKHDSKNKRIRLISDKYKNELDEDLALPFFQRVVLPVFRSITKRLSNLLPKNKHKKTNKTEKNLRLAGINLSVSEYNAVRLMLMLIFLMTGFLLTVFFNINTALKVLIILVAFLISVSIPVFTVKLKILKRQEEITNQLPDVMDLLSVSIEAGLGFDSALAKITERMSGLLVDELSLVLAEIQFGKPRREALRSLADRSPVEELKTFISSIIQAEQLGIPIRNVLNAQAQQLRATRRQKAEEKAMKAPVKMLLPLVALIFPVMLIILLGPMILQLIEQFA